MLNKTESDRLAQTLLDAVLSRYDAGASRSQMLIAVQKLLTPQVKEQIQEAEYIQVYRLKPGKKYAVVFTRQASDTFVYIVPDGKGYTLKSIQAEWKKLGRHVLDVHFLGEEEEQR